MGTNFKVGDLVRFSSYDTRLFKEYGDYECFGKLVSMHDQVNNKYLFDCDVITGYGAKNTKIDMIIKPIFYYNRIRYDIDFFDQVDISINPHNIYPCDVNSHLEYLDTIKNNISDIHKLIYNNQNLSILRKEKINSILNL